MVRDSRRVPVGAVLRAAERSPSANASGGVDGGFEIDGNFDAAADIDWASVLTVPTARDDNPENTVFSAASKENNSPESWSASGTPPDKADFSNIYTYDHVVSGHAWFYFAWERPSPSGSDGYYLELNKSANHQPQRNQRPDAHRW